MIKRLGLSLLLFVAGILHFLRPDLFFPAIPDFLIFKYEIILGTGIIELFLGFGLLIKKWSDLSARLTTYYFIALLPVHIYVSAEGIEIFGIKNSTILWSRTLFQFVLISWAYFTDSQSWIIQQRWKDVIFLHYKVSPDVLAHLVPYPLDLYDGQAIISIVPFQMDKIRFPFLPAFPWISRLWELNIRTYVDVNGTKGVYFFTLETDSKLGTLIARFFFSLPYRFSKIKTVINKDIFHFTHQRSPYSFSLKAKLGPSQPVTSFETWATERYSLFTRRGNVDWRGDVSHSPWTLHSIEVLELKDDFTKMIASNLEGPISVSYSPELEVRFKPFKKVPPMTEAL